MRFQLGSLVFALGFLGTANAYIACYSSQANCENQCSLDCAYDPGVVTGLDYCCSD